MCEKRLLKEHKRKVLKTEVMIVTPRRFGKTFAVAQYVAAFTAAVHGKEVAIFSTGRRASKKMLDLVVRFLMPLIAGKKKVITRNVEEILIRDEETGLNNKICSYPAKVQVRHAPHNDRKPAGRPKGPQPRKACAAPQLAAPRP